MPETKSNAYALSDNHTTNLYSESPLKQFEAGVPLYVIACKSGLAPMMKISDHTPACVKPATFKILVQRGWGTSILPGPSWPGAPNGGLLLINKTK